MNTIAIIIIAVIMKLFLLTVYLNYIRKKRAGKDAKWKYYTIKKNRWFSSPRFFLFNFGILREGALHINFDFSPECFYDYPDDNGWNKLFGFHRGNVHGNSARIGWRCIDGKIVLSAYCYVKGVRTIEKITEYDIEQHNYATIYETEDSYFFQINGKSCHIAKPKSWYSFRFLSFPYFGGVSPAPHTMTIKIKR